jgi:NAD(P)-dependent dehydrogenase (short-subunit alcohol dehydrogenase family)
MKLRGKAAIITGGEGSIGMATARAFVAQGARVCLVGLVEEELRAGAAELGEAAISEMADVTSSAQVKTAVARAAETFGRLDVVVSNAGISGVIAPVADYPEDVFDQVMAVHVRGSFLVFKHSLPFLRSGASIVITSSVVGLTSAAGICAYATAKHAQVGLMRTAARETATRGIRVNTIHPGPTDTAFQRAIEVAATGAPPDEAARAFDAMIPLGRHASPDEIARCVLYLASADSSFVTGSTLTRGRRPAQLTSRVAAHIPRPNSVSQGIVLVNGCSTWQPRYPGREPMEGNRGFGANSAMGPKPRISAS